ncbi:putative holin [Undibacterium sp. TJN19]|uniref:putative holin n=1 Tax=Undibacterium sp. TJN19 TaxID=3413055 RepID=UPI003BF19DBC
MKLPRMTGWLLIALALSIIIAATAPQQLPVSLYKLNLITIAGVVGYWLDRSLFPYARPDSFLARDLEDIENTTEVEDPPLQFELETFLQNDLLFATSMLRRALIVAASMIAVGLGA